MQLSWNCQDNLVFSCLYCILYIAALIDRLIYVNVVDVGFNVLKTLVTLKKLWRNSKGSNSVGINWHYIQINRKLETVTIHDMEMQLTH